MKNQPNIASNHTEIDLIELVRLLWSKKIFIGNITLLITLFASIFISILKPFYQAKFTFIPPTNNDIAELNLGRERLLNLKPITPADCFNIFRGVLLSDSAKQAFIKKQREVNPTKAPVSITTMLESAGRYSLTITAHSRADAEQNTLLFYNMILEQAREKIKSSLEHEINVVNRHYQQRVTLALKSAQTMREDQLVRLKEALVLAQKLKIEEPSPLSGLDASIPNPSYSRGVKRLTAEIKSLEERKSDVPYFPKLRDLEQQHNDIMVFKPDFKDIKLALIDHNISISGPINRHKYVLLVFSILGGFVLGCSIVILRNFKSLLSVQNRN
ncbi:Wzz/FepE/Etk N-terminal domain-containing protein [Legionella brunensis]|uniref:Chain length determinant protein n=1 Tax=Legionella brunensis TaxID=29422 RepID=A0A0W0SD25_9GAMM|nr:Wzz/FepE/Etk N-terminal domain-containing protein [Legionella brunensis]KTC81423.1 Chain length determinant protein [Legionella brunensis]